MFAAGAHIGWADQCESALQLTQFDQTHTVNSTLAVTSIIDQLNLHQLTKACSQTLLANSSSSVSLLARAVAP